MKIRSKSLLLVVACAAAPALAQAAKPDKPAEIRVPRTTGAITIDGKLDEADWQKAPRIVLRKLDGTPAARPTEARILHDGDHAYIAFKAEDPDIWTAHEARDAHMWTEDVVEVFFDVDPAEPGYVEIEVNPKGGLFDGMFFAHRKNVVMSWNPAIQVAVAVDGTVNARDDKDRSWTVEMSIPVAELAPAQAVQKPNPPLKSGTEWRMEFCRNDSSKGLEDELQSWTPVPNDFHATAAYGRVIFE